MPAATTHPIVRVWVDVKKQLYHRRLAIDVPSQHAPFGSQRT